MGRAGYLAAIALLPAIVNQKSILGVRGSGGNLSESGVGMGCAEFLKRLRDPHDGPLVIGAAGLEHQIVAGAPGPFPAFDPTQV